MKRIESIKELREERRLARMRVLQLEEQIKIDFEEIKDDLKPLKMAGKAIKTMMVSEKDTVLGTSIGLTVDALIKKLFLRKSGFLTKTIVAFILKNYTRNIVSKNSDSILDWVQSLFLNYKKKHQHNGQYYDESTVDMDLEL